MQGSLFDNLKRFDRQRPSFPGEHWLAFAAGLWLLSRPAGSSLAGMSAKAIGAALIYRAASGRDGLRRLWSPSGAGGRAIRPDLRSDKLVLDAEAGAPA